MNTSSFEHKDKLKYLQLVELDNVLLLINVVLSLLYVRLKMIALSKTRKAFSSKT